MKRFKLFLYLALLVFVVGSIFLLLNTHAVSEEVGFESFSGLLRTWAIIGIILILVDLVTENIHIQKLRHEKNQMEKEMLTLKAKLYDHEISRGDKEVKPVTETPKTETPQIEEESKKEEGKEQP